MSASDCLIPSQTTNAIMMYAVVHVWPGLWRITVKNFSSGPDLLIIHLARGHPWEVLPSFPEYRSFSMRMAFPLAPDL